ncbi:MAG: hypothetical protein ACM3VZ_11450 [Acidobacteriota bacterium]
MTAKIIELDRATIEDAATVLRAIADEIDAGKHGKVSAAVVIVDGDELALFGSGDASQYKAVWLLEAAKQELLP